MDDIQRSSTDLLWPRRRLVLEHPRTAVRLPSARAIARAAKRGLDLVLAALFLLALAPLCGLIAVLIRLDSPGPVLFRQRRLGLRGERFTIYKFRTMRPDAEERLRDDPELYETYVENDYKLPPERDPRITTAGAVLRRTSLDELPQLWNVLKGEMSLVGPRPIVEPELEKYGRKASLLLGVRPGLTGAWQVSGRSEVGYPERVEIDHRYIERWSLGTDLRILVRTVPVVLARLGAY